MTNTCKVASTYKVTDTLEKISVTRQFDGSTLTLKSAIDAKKYVNKTARDAMRQTLTELVERVEATFSNGVIVLSTAKQIIHHIEIECPLDHELVIEDTVVYSCSIVSAKLLTLHNATCLMCTLNSPVTSSGSVEVVDSEFNIK